MQIFEPSTEVTVTGGGIKETISNFNDQGYCSILKVLIILCKHASKNSCVTCRIFITSTICVFIASFSTIWLSIPAGSNKYRLRKLRAYILVSFLVQSCGFEFFSTKGLGLEQWTGARQKPSPTVSSVPSKPKSAAFSNTVRRI